MKRSMILAVAVVVILVVAVGGYLAVSSMSKSSSSTQTTVSGANGIEVISDSLTVNANAGTGLWSISVENTGTLSVSTMYANIATNPPLLLCSGNTPSAGLEYKNCPSTAGSPLPPNAIINGSSSGTGASSATVGNSYAVSVHLTFTGGQTAWVNSTIIATSS